MGGSKAPEINFFSLQMPTVSIPLIRSGGLDRHSCSRRPMIPFFKGAWHPCICPGIPGLLLGLGLVRVSASESGGPFSHLLSEEVGLSNFLLLKFEMPYSADVFFRIPAFQSPVASDRSLAQNRSQAARTTRKPSAAAPCPQGGATSRVIPSTSRDISWQFP